MIRVGINGFGRIGRSIYRANLDKKFFDIVAINDINPDICNIAYTINYDTLYGRLKNQVSCNNGVLDDGFNHPVKVYHKENIEDVDWGEHELDYLIDSSGVLRNVIGARMLIEKSIVSRVFVTHSPSEVDFTMVLGANHADFDVKKHKIISTSICDATAIAPVVKLINDNYGIKNGYITTLHPWLNYQNLMDGPSSSWSVPGEIYHHYALGRSAIGNMIPKPTSAIDATRRVLSCLQNVPLGSFSYRTPAAIVGSADITLYLKSSTNKNQVIKLFETIEDNQKNQIIHNNFDPLVSLDFLRSEFSAIVDHRWTDVIDGNLLKIVLWYDNEYAYASRVVDQIVYVNGEEQE